jgi:hypothetical protein
LELLGSLAGGAQIARWERAVNIPSFENLRDDQPWRVGKQHSRDQGSDRAADFVAPSSLRR